MRVPWLQLLRHRQTWAFVAAKFMTDPIWWFFLFWLPKFLNAEYGLTLHRPRACRSSRSTCMADVGSIARRLARGTFHQARLEREPCAQDRDAHLRAGRGADRVRIRAPTTCGSRSALIGLATAGHQGWSANVFTLTSDMFPRRTVASVVGIGGFAGAVGGMMIATFTGFLLEATGSYVPVFMMAGSAYLLALAVVHLLVPRLEPAHNPVRARERSRRHLP